MNVNHPSKATLPKILIVDDDEVNIRLLERTLHKHYQVITAQDGQAALDFAVTCQPNLILLDVLMPKMNGYEVCRRLKSGAQAHIPVIFVSALDDNRNEKDGFDLGAVDYITKPICPEIVLRRVETHLSLIHIDTMDTLARSAIEMLGEAGHYNDFDTGAHIWRMAAFTRAIAEASGWSMDERKMLELAAPMHDTGKVGIPHTILKAPRKLNQQEWEIMMTHSQIGYDILSISTNPVFQLAAEIALCHHEKWDGSGYPNGRTKTQIPSSSQIVAIADVFDALTAKRPYKEAWSIEAAVAEINQLSGSHFDPKLVKVFTKIVPEIETIKKVWENLGFKTRP